MKRHSIVMDDAMWEALRIVSFAKKKSISEILREAVENYLMENKEYQKFLRLAAIPPVSDKEQKEIEKILQGLTEEDKAIGETWEYEV
ncbi:MAG: hypothetical protein J7L52_01670 [Thermotogae bacterium]|nr:hypothetical protein [Thermotogota bacterium]